MHISEHKRLRQRLMATLYREQEHNTKGSGLHVDELEKQFGADLTFDLHYLVDKGYVRWHVGFVKLTVTGIDAVEGEDDERKN